jgi:hypothetical protein
MKTRPNEALLRTGTRPGFRRSPSVSSRGDLAFNEKCQVPVAEVGRSAESHAVDTRPA